MNSGGLISKLRNNPFKIREILKNIINFHRMYEDRYLQISLFSGGIIKYILQETQAYLHMPVEISDDH